jgi:hypothetical protein
MSDPDPGNTGDARESFVERWSRLKNQARSSAAPGGAPSLPAAARPAADVPVAEPAPGKPPAIELPDLAQLGQDADYSAFLTPGVDAALRRRALRQLFSSPKFNVCDGLDTYRDDFRNFTPLGDVVTADMRHQIERLAQEAAKALDTPGSDVAPVSAAAVAPTPAVTPTTEPDVPADSPPAATDEQRDHRPG